MTEDADLLAGVARGDPDWEAIFRAFHQDVHAAAQRVLGSGGRVVDSKDVEDVVQQTFEEAMKGGVLTPDTRSIAAKLRSVARRRALDAVRRGAKTSDQPVEEVIGIQDPVADEIEALVDHEFEIAIAQAVWRNQRRLSSRERIVFRAHTAEGLRFSDIAARLHLTPQRVGQIYRDAIRKLTQGVDLTGEGGEV